MIHYKNALSKLKQNKIKIKSEIVTVEKSLNRISSINVSSPNNYPAANNTAFDGFANNSNETININNKNRNSLAMNFMPKGFCYADDSSYNYK